jgi:hypothetical protein
VACFAYSWLIDEIFKSTALLAPLLTTVLVNYGDKKMINTV